jgi:hypothetical protein
MIVRTFISIKVMDMNNKNTLQAGERSDCTVRALVKTAGLAYDDAWKWVSIKMQRRPRKGPSLYAAVRAMDNAQQINGKKVKTLKRNRLTRFLNGADRKMSLKTFCQHNPVGTFYVLVRGHALAVIDGRITDYTKAGKRVTHAWEFVS